MGARKLGFNQTIKFTELLKFGSYSKIAAWGQALEILIKNQKIKFFKRL